MSKGQYEFTDYAIVPDCARDKRELEVLWQLRHQMPVEVSDRIKTLGPSERWRNKEIGVLGHRRESRIEIAVNDFCFPVVGQRFHHSLLRRCEVGFGHETLLSSRVNLRMIRECAE